MNTHRATYAVGSDGYAVVVQESEPKPQVARSRMSCKGKCTSGNDCVCWSMVGHNLHICKKPDCQCHGKDRYEGERKAGKEKR